MGTQLKYISRNENYQNFTEFEKNIMFFSVFCETPDSSIISEVLNYVSCIKSLSNESSDVVDLISDTYSTLLYYLLCGSYFTAALKMYRFGYTDHLRTKLMIGSASEHLGQKPPVEAHTWFCVYIHFCASRSGHPIKINWSEIKIQNHTLCAISHARWPKLLSGQFDNGTN